MQHVSSIPPLSFLADRFNGKSIADIARDHDMTPAAVASLLTDTAHAILADVGKAPTIEPFTVTLAEDMPDPRSQDGGGGACGIADAGPSV